MKTLFKHANPSTEAVFHKGRVQKECTSLAYIKIFTWRNMHLRNRKHFPCFYLVAEGEVVTSSYSLSRQAAR